MFYSICYDIRDDHRRNQVVKALKDYGERVQLSVFEANLRPEELSRLKERLKSIIDRGEDNVRIYPLCAACIGRIEIMGPGMVTQDPEIIII